MLLCAAYTVPSRTKVLNSCRCWELWRLKALCRVPRWGLLSAGESHPTQGIVCLLRSCPHPAVGDGEHKGPVLDPIPDSSELPAPAPPAGLTVAFCCDCIVVQLLSLANLVSFTPHRAALQNTAQQTFCIQVSNSESASHRT